MGYIGFPVGLAGKESACNVGDLGSIPGLGRSPGEVNGYPLQYSGLEKNSVDNISPWGCKELDMTERLSHWVIEFQFHLLDLHWVHLIFNLFLLIQVKRTKLFLWVTHAGLPSAQMTIHAGKGTERSHKCLSHILCVFNITMPLPEILLWGHILADTLSPGNKLEDSVWLKASCATSQSWSLLICKITGGIKRKKKEHGLGRQSQILTAYYWAKNVYSILYNIYWYIWNAKKKDSNGCYGNYCYSIC